MSKTRRRHVVAGLFDDGTEVEFNGCGWSLKGKGKRYDRHDADQTAFDVNCAGDITAWREEVR
jgi:hypothetical protein